MSGGYFKEKEAYYLEETLANDSHYGVKLTYEHSVYINHCFSTSLKGQSGWYIDGNNMNDVDYSNLSSDDTTQTTTPTQVLSRITNF